MNTLTNLAHNIMTDKYIILNLNTMDYMKDSEGKLCVYDNLDEANNVCGIYELNDVWICKLISYHKEN